ncbi:MAG TPA: pyruvate kinase [Chloroflexota bacterium]|nr:pyruvate kinase [Chloroflexota bacterium]
MSKLLNETRAGGVRGHAQPDHAPDRGLATRGARRAKIVGTIGPTSCAEEQLAALLRAGLDAARLNMAHGTHDQHAAVVADVRRLAREMDRAVALLFDLQGPKIRTGSLAGGPVALVEGAPFTITTRPVPGDAHAVSTTYAPLPHDVVVGDTILLADGLLELQVLGTTVTDVLCRVVHGGFLHEHKGINLPGVCISAPALTLKDEADLAFGIAQGVDYIALSFVRQAADVLQAKALLAQRGAAIPVIAKLEKPEALEHLDEILAVADGVMIARGDLGVESPLEGVPLIQKDIILRANRAGVLVITATQMLESMIAHPRPTRAEASDVANAVLDGTDAVMLSQETAMGQYPVAAVETMARIVVEAERESRRPVHALDQVQEHAHALARAAAALAAHTPVRALVVFTQSGFSARLVSKERPAVPILAFTPDRSVYDQLALWWGVTPKLCAFRRTIDEQLTVLQDALLSGGHAVCDDTVIIMGSLPVLEGGRTNFLKLHRIDDARERAG